LDKFPESSIASGIICKKAPANQAPAEKDTKGRIIFLRVFSFKDKVIKPTKDNKLMAKELKIIIKNILIF